MNGHTHTIRCQYNNGNAGFETKVIKTLMKLGINFGLQRTLLSTFFKS